MEVKDSGGVLGEILGPSIERKKNQKVKNN